jgi:hypothetical protein
MMAGPFYSPGSYECQVTSFGLGESSNGNPMVTLRVRVAYYIEAPGTALPVSQEYERDIRLVVTDKTTEMVLKKLRHAGWTGDRFEALGSIVGTTVRCTCKHEPGIDDKANQLFERWDLTLPPLQKEPLETNSQVAKRLNALFGKALKEGSGPKPAEVEQPVTVSTQADDVPF